MEEAIDNILGWATSHGVQYNGIRPQQMKGQGGIGIFAARQLAAGEVVLRVPEAMLRTIHNTPKRIVSALPQNASTHAILAASLILDTHPDLKIWAALFPSRQDVWASMPICWPPSLQALLPDGAKEILKAQQDKYSKDWFAFTAAFPTIRKEEFLYHWLLVNTRTFYFRSKGKGKGRANATWSSTEKNMALQPIADLFNHIPGDHCEAAFTADGFRFTTNRAYKAGEELFVRYGAHDNDKLLVEYGFTMPLELNPWDELALTAYMRPLFTRGQRELLEETQFWGKYALDCKGVCYRTQIALRLHCLPEDTWKQIIAGERDEDRDSDVVNARLKTLLEGVALSIAKTLEQLEEVKVEVFSKYSRMQLRARWLEIRKLVRLELDRLSDVVTTDPLVVEDEEDGEGSDGGEFDVKARLGMLLEEEEAMPEKISEVSVLERSSDGDEEVPEWA